MVPPEPERLAVMNAASNRWRPPAKNETMAEKRMAMTTYWNLVAQSVPSHEKMKRMDIATAAITCAWNPDDKPIMPETASPNPMQ